MSHLIEIGRGVARKPTWHRLLKCENLVTTDIDLFAERAGMAYRITKEPATILRQGRIDEVPDQFHLVRSDDQKVVSPATVTSAYGIVQPSDVIERLRPYVQEGWATPDAFFTLQGGSKEVYSLRLDFSLDIAGDSSDYDHYMVVSNAHGRGALRGKLTSVRVVCNNTLTSAFASGADFFLPHRSGVVPAFDQAMQTWAKLKDYIRAMSEKLGLLVQVPCNIPLTVRELLDITEDSSTRAKTKADRIIDQTFRSENCVGPNLLSVLNGFTAFLTHDDYGSRGSFESLTDSQLYGARASLEQDITTKLLARLN